MPLLDWRVLEEPPRRIPSIDPRKLGKRPFLKGFGGFGERSTVSIPWRDAETVFFHAKQAIRLPAHLPGGNPVQRVLRRVFIGEAQVRFELAAFASLQPSRLRSTRYGKAARQWWSAPVQIKHGVAWHGFPFDVALHRLAGRFERETNFRFGSESNTPSISVLQPQIMLVCLAQRSDIPPSAISVIQDPPVWYFHDSRIIKSHVPDLSFVFLAEDAVPSMGIEGFSVIRRIRRELAWLHADLQVFLEIGRAIGRGDRPMESKLWKMAGVLANGLSQLDQDAAYGFEPLLFSAWSQARTNMLSLLRTQVGMWGNGEIPRPQWLRGPVRYKTDERQRIYLQTVEHRLKSVRNEYPDDRALQLGEVSLVDKTSLGGEASANYSRERTSAFDSYSGLPREERLRVSIVVPVRGGVFPLVASLESIARQTLVRECPEDIEILLIEDGPLDLANPVIGTQEILAVLKNVPKDVRVVRFVLQRHMGRATARNVGIFRAQGDILLFVDASMVLDPCHLAELVIRHARIPNIALLGFKENLRLASYTIESCRDVLTKLQRHAIARQDWKWHHVIQDDELDADGVFRFRTESFREGDVINYMKLTDYLKGLSATESIGPRSLATFFQTNIVSVPIGPVRQVGGFHSRAFKDKLWGLEDSHLGALLLAHGVRFVPCPSAVAFKIEHEQDLEQRRFDLNRHRQLYDELVRERVRHRAHEAEEEIKKLRDHGNLVEL